MRFWGSRLSTHRAWNCRFKFVFLACCFFSPCYLAKLMFENGSFQLFVNFRRRPWLRLDHFRMRVHVCKFIHMRSRLHFDSVHIYVLAPVSLLNRSEIFIIKKMLEIYISIFFLNHLLIGIVIITDLHTHACAFHLDWIMLLSL